MLLLAFLLLAGCDHQAAGPSNGSARSLVVHGVLLAGTHEQEILVEYTRGVGEGIYKGITPASGAEVTVTGHAVHRFVEDPKRPGSYRASFTPRPGGLYMLRIRGPGGEAVSSWTRIPGTPQLTAPSRDTVVQRAVDVVFRWTATTDASGYMVVFYDTARPRFPFERPVIRAEDNAVTVQLGLMGERQMRLAVAAADSNYLRYVQMRFRDPGPKYRFQSTVEGGWGLFGSAALSDSRLISFVR